MVAARVREHYVEAAKERQKLASGGDRRSDQAKKNQGVPKREHLDSTPKSLASEQAGAALNVSRQSVARALVESIGDGLDPDLV